jgi:segregation and condensation protein B
MSENAGENSMTDLMTKVEALLFVAPSPISISQLSSLLNEKPKTVEETIKLLGKGYLNNRGMRLQECNGRFQLTSSPDNHELIEQFLGQEESSSLSQAALEALSIVAYRQPITRPDVDEIRGVNSDGVMRNLLNKGLIQEIGRSEGAGRPILYGTTIEFLQYFGLSSLKELPEFESSPDSALPGGKILKD